MSFTDVAKAVANLVQGIQDAVQDELREARDELAAQYAVTIINLRSAQAMIEAARRDTNAERARSTLRSAQIIIDTTEQKLIGKVLGLGFEMRNDVKDLFTVTRTAIKAVLELPIDAAKAAGHQIAATTIGAVVVLGVVAWLYAKGK